MLFRHHDLKGLENNIYTSWYKKLGSDQQVLQQASVALFAQANLVPHWSLRLLDCKTFETLFLDRVSICSPTKPGPP